MVLVTLFVIPLKSTASFCGCTLGRCQLQHKHAPSTRETTPTVFTLPNVKDQARRTAEQGRTEWPGQGRTTSGQAKPGVA